MRSLQWLRFGVRDLRAPETRGFELRDVDFHLAEAIAWLCRAQNASGDGGVSISYSLVRGWGRSYPETTGYIIPTFLNYTKLTGNQDYANRAFRMADWEISIQRKDGSFDGGPLGSGLGSFVFDTGQVVFGLLAAHRVSGDSRYGDAARRAGDWLVDVLDSDGAWRRHTYNGIPHVYYARVAWALAELGVHTGESSYLEAARRNIRWVLSRQNDKGWFDDAGFHTHTHARPYTHTIAYTIRGVLETGRCLGETGFIDAAARAAAALHAKATNGSFQGTYDCEWRSRDAYACLTGNAQISTIFLRLFDLRGDRAYLDAAQRVNRFLCQCQPTQGAPAVRGAISGSYPIWGEYQRLAFPNWAAKFFADALMFEKISTGTWSLRERAMG